MIIVDLFICTLPPSAGETTYLLAVVSDRRQDGTQGLDAHGDVQQMSSEEEVVEVSKNGHGGVPDQIQEVLQEKRGHFFVTNDGFNEKSKNASLFSVQVVCWVSP